MSSEVRGELVCTQVPTRVETLRLSSTRWALAGSMEQLRCALSRLRDEGRLVGVDGPTPDGRPGVYAVTVRLAPPARRPVPVVAAPRVVAGFWTAGRIVAASVGLVMAGSALWLTVAALAWLTAHIAVVLGVVAGLAALSLLGRRCCTTVINIFIKH